MSEGNNASACLAAFCHGKCWKSAVVRIVPHGMGFTTGASHDLFAAHVSMYGDRNRDSVFGHNVHLSTCDR